MEAKRSTATASKSNAGAIVPMNQEKASTGTPTMEQIAQRAYELFLARGAEHGHDVEDWVQAERQLKLGRQ